MTEKVGQQSSLSHRSRRVIDVDQHLSVAEPTDIEFNKQTRDNYFDFQECPPCCLVYWAKYMGFGPDLKIKPCYCCVVPHARVCLCMNVSS